MAKHTPRSGGFFLMTAILVGFAWGVSAGHPMAGILTGTGVGIGIALATWLLDRRRRAD